MQGYPIFKKMLRYYMNWIAHLSLHIRWRYWIMFGDLEFSTK